MNPIQVSVIVPIYNMEDNLPRCVDSILSQTYEKFELILVDDGSTDNSPQICDCYRKMDSRIKVIHKSNGGLSSARNAGLDVADGNYIYFADSDDYIEPVLLERTIALMESQQCDWVAFGMIKEDTQGKHIENIAFKPTQTKISGEEDRMVFLLKYLLNYRLGWEACSHVFRGDIIRENNLRFVSERTVFAEDMLFAFTYWLYAKSCIVIQDCLYHYVQRTDSLMGKSKFRNVLPQMHELAKEAYAAVVKAGLSRIQKNFAVIYLHLLEWQARPYVAGKGVGWVKKALGEFDYSQFLPEEYSRLRLVYQDAIGRYGDVDGVVTVVIPVLSEGALPQAEAYIEKLLTQTLQKLDVLILCREELELGRKDIRIRQSHRECLDANGILRAAFEESRGEYIYFADYNIQIPVDFLERSSDVLKYNASSTVIMTQDWSSFIDRDSIYDRRKFREYLRANNIPYHKAMIRRDLLEESGLAGMGNLQEFIADIILSGHTILIQNEW